MRKPAKQLPPLFSPPPLIRNQHVQTIVPSLYRRDGDQLRAASQQMILTASDGVRLQGFYAPQAKPAKGLVFLLHGWLGCAESNYNITLGEHLYHHGYSVFRLNYRDHGETHHLNPGLFRGDLLDEVFDAARQVARLAPEMPFHVIGPSLGGSFALRIAWRHKYNPIPALQQIIAINPAVNPYRATMALDRNPIYLRYFRKKWRISLQKKQSLFPDRYKFGPEIFAGSCVAMTQAVMSRYSPHPDAVRYFNSYRVTPEMMVGLTQPVTLLTAADDPIIPVEDLHVFRGVSKQLRLIIVPHGGHVGYVTFPLQFWLTKFVESVLAG